MGNLSGSGAPEDVLFQGNCNNRVVLVRTVNVLYKMAGVSLFTVQYDSEGIQPSPAPALLSPLQHQLSSTLSSTRCHQPSPAPAVTSPLQHQLFSTLSSTSCPQPSPAPAVLSPLQEHPRPPTNQRTPTDREDSETSKSSYRMEHYNELKYNPATPSCLRWTANRWQGRSSLHYTLTRRWKP